MSYKDHIRNLIKNYSRRLQKLKEQQALYGLDASPQLLIEIEDIEAKISDLTELQVKLEQLVKLKERQVLFGLVSPSELLVEIESIGAKIADLTQQVLFGVDVPTEFLTEIEGIGTKITDLTELQTKLEELKKVPKEITPVDTSDSSKEQSQSISEQFLGESPFVLGGAVPPDLFYGRKGVLKIIARRIGSRTLQSISIVGERRIGKSSLLNYIVTQPEQFLSQSTQYVFIYLDLMKGYCHTRANLFKTIRRELQKALGWEPWSSNEDGDLGAFDFALEEVISQGKKLILCLDQMENLTKRPREFDEILEDWRANGQMGQMAMITSSTQPLAELCKSGGLISPFYNIFLQETLGLLSKSEWEALIYDHFKADREDILFTERVAGGHPFFTQMAAETLWYAYQGNNLNYEGLYQKLLTQIEPHLAGLWRVLSPAEQSILRDVAVGRKSPQFDKRILNSLYDRGFLRDNRPFSDAFTNLIRSGLWA